VVIAAISGTAHDVVAVSDPLSRFPIVPIDSDHCTPAQAIEAIRTRI
jgi:hypothetical protein